MIKSLVSIGFGLLLLITGIFISNLIIDLNKSEPTYNNNSLTSVYIELVKNDSNKIEIERNGKLQSSNRISIISEVQGIKKKNRTTIISDMLPLKMEEEGKEVFQILIFLNTFQIYLKIFLEKVLAEVEEEEEGLTIEALT